MTALRNPGFISIDDYLAGEQVSETKHEYLGGIVHAMSGGTRNHSAIATNATTSLQVQLRGKKCRPFNSDLKVRLDLPDHTRFYYPDAQVVCQNSSGDTLYEGHPVVILEVLSPSTRRADLGEKRDAYLTLPSLRVLILAEADQPYVLVHRRRKDGGFATEEYAALDCVIPLPEIDAVLALAELYEAVEFTAPD